MEGSGDTKMYKRISVFRELNDAVRAKEQLQNQ